MGGGIFQDCVVRFGPMRKIKPWDLEPEEIQERVTDFRISKEITRGNFAEAVSMDLKTLRKIERGIKVDPMMISRVANTFPQIFA